MAEEQFGDVPLEHLSLDPLNPRLPNDRDWTAASEDDLLHWFERRYNLLELARSIADKGFRPRHAEALLVVEDPPGSQRFVTVEGNRRLATLKLLLSADRRAAVRIRSSEWDELATSERLEGLQERVPVVEYPNREALNDYLGFRHITGPTPWRPEAKARFVAKLLGHGETIDAVVKRIGSNHRTVRRLIDAHAVYVQAQNAGYSMEGVEAAFGVFYNALDRPGIREFLELAPQSVITSHILDPVPDSAMDNLRELIGFLYGDDDGLEKVIVESRELKKLEEVLADSRALANLRAHRDLDGAWHVSGGGRQELMTLLDDAHRALVQVNGQALEYSDDVDIQEEVTRIRNLVMDMVERYRVQDT